MRCFACSKDLSDDAPEDRPTGRFYCIDCYEPTLDVQLAQQAHDWHTYRDTGKAGTSHYGHDLFFDLEHCLDMMDSEPVIAVLTESEDLDG